MLFKLHFNRARILSDKKDKPPAISIAPHIFASKDFDKLYSEGMALIEDIASYLDGEGRKESRELNREASFLYASESMKLTTRLMQLASWLLLQRAVSEGEISSKSARDEKEKVKLSQTPIKRGGPGWSELPEALIGFIAKGDRLYERIIQFDQLDKNSVEQAGKEANISSAAQGGIADQLSRIKAAFGDKK